MIRGPGGASFLGSVPSFFSPSFLLPGPLGCILGSSGGGGLRSQTATVFLDDVDRSQPSAEKPRWLTRDPFCFCGSIRKATSPVFVSHSRITPLPDPVPTRDSRGLKTR